MLCNAKLSSSRSTSRLKPKNFIGNSICNLVGTEQPQKRYILRFTESERLRSYLLDYLRCSSDKQSSETAFVVLIAQIASEHKRIILTETELSNLKTILQYIPSPQQTEELK